MSIKHLLGLFYQELFITLRSLDVLLDIFFFSLITLLVFGYISLFLIGSTTSLVAHYFLLGAVFWEVIRITQYCVSINSLWNVWSRNLSNLFIAPVSVTEYIFSQLLSGLWKSAIVFLLISSLTSAVFHFSIFSVGLINILFYYINLVIFGWWTGIIVLGLIFCFGTRIQALAWSLIFLFQPLTAAFFPVAVLPIWLQKIAYCFPPTWIFEAARTSISTNAILWPSIGRAFAENVAYFILALFIFRGLYRKSLSTGQFARNES